MNKNIDNRLYYCNDKRRMLIKVKGIRQYLRLNRENISFERSHYSRNYFVEVGTIGFLGDEILRLIEITLLRVSWLTSWVAKRLTVGIGLIPSLSSKIGFLICARREYGMSISLAGIS